MKRLGLLDLKNESIKTAFGSKLTFWSELIHLQNESVTLFVTGASVVAALSQSLILLRLSIFHRLNSFLAIALQNCRFHFLNAAILTEKRRR
jgi:hypothetical protein